MCRFEEKPAEGFLAMKSAQSITLLTKVALCLTLMLVAKVASAVVVASDNASLAAYASEAGGAWKGQYNPGDLYQIGQNPPGTDNGGTGFGAWDFSGGVQVANDPDGVPPYGNLNHFIDGIDFSTTAYNDMGAHAFGFGNCNI